MILGLDLINSETSIDTRAHRVNPLNSRHFICLISYCLIPKRELRDELLHSSSFSLEGVISPDRLIAFYDISVLFL